MGEGGDKKFIYLVKITKKSLLSVKNVWCLLKMPKTGKKQKN